MFIQSALVCTCYLLLVIPGILIANANQELRRMTKAWIPQNRNSGACRTLFAAPGGKDAQAAPGLEVDDGFFPARPGDFALCGAQPGALPLDPTTFEKVDETFILCFALVIQPLIRIANTPL